MPIHGLLRKSQLAPAHNLDIKDGPSADKSFSFDPRRHLQAQMDMQSPEQAKNGRTTFSAFGAGAYTCLGVHLAWMEMRLAFAYFLRECPGATLGPTADKDMQMVNYFVITPKGKKCEISMR